MPRFHFNVYNGVSFVDREGQELAGWDEARIEAIRQSGDIIKGEAKRIALGEDWRMEITDERGLVLFRLDFIVVASAATSRPPLGRKH